MIKEKIKQILDGKIDPFLFVMGKSQDCREKVFFMENKGEIKKEVHRIILDQEVTLYQLYCLIVVLFETNTLSIDVEKYLSHNLKESKNADNMKLLKTLIAISDNKNGFEEYVREISMAFEQR